MLKEKIMIKRFFIQIVLLLPLTVGAQIGLSLQSAVDTALKNNFDIRIARNNAFIGKINNKLGMAGALPSVNFNAVDNESFTNIDQKLNSGAEIKKNNSVANNLTSGISASITLFNGLKVISAKSRLNCQQKQSELILNQQVQNIMAAVMIKYYDIIRQLGYLKVLQNSVDVSRKKLEIVSERSKAGMANEADMLQAQIDLNLSEQNMKSQALVVDQAKTDLLQLICVKKHFEYDVKDSILVDESIVSDSVYRFMMRNPQLLSAEQQIKISEFTAKEVAAQRYPSLKLNAAYNFNLTKSDAGLTIFNQNYGPMAGLSLQIPLFNGNVYNIQHKTALYNVNDSKLQKESLLGAMLADAIKTYQSYKNNLQQMKSQQGNLVLAGKLVRIVLEKFRLNQSTILDVKTAQSSYESNAYLLLNLQYAAKASEIELKRLMYNLKN